MSEDIRDVIKNQQTQITILKIVIGMIIGRLHALDDSFTIEKDPIFRTLLESPQMRLLLDEGELQAAVQLMKNAAQFPLKP